MIPIYDTGKKSKTVQTGKRPMVGEGEGEMNRWSAEGGWGSENTLYNTIAMGALYVSPHL